MPSTGQTKEDREMRTFRRVLKSRPLGEMWGPMTDSYRRKVLERRVREERTAFGTKGARDRALDAIAAHDFESLNVAKKGPRRRLGKLRKKKK